MWYISNLQWEWCSVWLHIQISVFPSQVIEFKFWSFLWSVDKVTSGNHWQIASRVTSYIRYISIAFYTRTPETKGKLPNSLCVKNHCPLPITLHLIRHGRWNISPPSAQCYLNIKSVSPGIGILIIKISYGTGQEVIALIQKWLKYFYQIIQYTIIVRMTCTDVIDIIVALFPK